MSHLLYSIALHAYLTAALLLLGHLIRPFRVGPPAARVFAVLGAGCHGAALGMTLWAQGGGPIGFQQACSSVSFLLVAISIAADLRYRQPVLGAFLLPFATAVLVPALMGDSGVVPASLKGPILPLHVSVALLGLAAVGAAAGVALIYLVMERQVKLKHFGLLFTRLPPLQVLDELNRRLVVWGFVAISLTVITGAFFIRGSTGLSWSPKEVATLAAWVMFGALVAARVLAGWRGRRVALLTMAGFGVLLVSFFSAFDTVSGSGGVH
jgi:ABC-type uncharacterized transport system permease subunit